MLTEEKSTKSFCPTCNTRAYYKNKPEIWRGVHSDTIDTWAAQSEKISDSPYWANVAVKVNPCRHYPEKKCFMENIWWELYGKSGVKLLTSVDFVKYITSNSQETQAMRVIYHTSGVTEAAKFILDQYKKHTNV